MSINCSNLQKNKSFCTCTYEPCSRKGNCCACVEYHQRMNELPGCFFTVEGERTYDRSYKNFVKSVK
jgi:hypothetical protein